MTRTWHDDDLKASNEDINELTEFGNFLKSKYEKDGMKLTDYYVDVHDYLGINLDFLIKGQMGVSMIQYPTDIINSFSKDVDKPSPCSPCPTADHLYQVLDEKDTEYISEKKAWEFHHVTAQLLFLCNRARRDIQTAVTVVFLTARVKQPDINDWGKLCRVLKYLKGSKYIKLVLTINDLSTIRWWVDALDRCHPDYQGHTGTMMSLGEGAIISSSRKQNDNTKSLIKSELVSLLMMHCP